MADLASLVKQLIAEAQPRPDLITPGSTGELTNTRPMTMFGRVVHANQVAEQNPVNVLKGILNKPATAEAEAGGQALGAIPQSLLAGGAAKAVMIPAMRAYHGTPSSLAGSLPTREMGKVYGPMAGAPGHFVASTPDAASEYARGAISEAGALTAQGNYGPNVRPYMMQAHQSLGTTTPVQANELTALLDTLQKWTPAAKQTKHGTITPEMQRMNLINAIQNQVLPDASPGGHLRDIMSSMVGQKQAEDLLKQSGFKSIHYLGEHAGIDNTQAFKVLDNTILQNLFKALTKERNP